MAKMKISTSFLIGLLSIVWRVQCAPKIPKATAITDVGVQAATAAAATAPEWYCETICAGGCSGRPYYDSHKQVCRCTINEHIDDGDKELVLKTAKIAYLNFKLIDQSKPVKKREADESLRSSEEAEITTVEDSEEEPTTKNSVPPKKFGIGPLKPFNTLFEDFTARLNQPQVPLEMFPQDAILGQLDPSLQDSEPHHNIYAAPPAPPKSLFGGPLLGQMNPSIKEIEPHHNINAGYPTLPAPIPSAPFPTHMTPALTRSLLMTVRDKLDNLLLRTQQYPYQPAVTAHETESMRNTLKQITQVNVNVRPIGTTFGYFFNNLVNHVLRAEAPNSTLVDSNEQPVETVTSSIGHNSFDHYAKKNHKSKSGKATEIGKKTSTKGTTTTTEKFVYIEDTSPLEMLSAFDIPPSTTTTTTTTEAPLKTFFEDHHETHESLPIEHLFPMEEVNHKEETTPKFLPHEEDDDIVGEDYLYDDDPHMDK